jgi:predicted enzyme related to lactoylglutathione lyase
MTVHELVHLELHTGDAGRESAFYARLLGWRPEQIDTAHGAYAAFEIGGGVGGGIVECGATPAAWVPYVQVGDIAAATTHAQELGATLRLAPREGPAGWRSVVADPCGAYVALWQAKETR